MRWVFLLFCLASFSFPVRAQQQEKKLVDRLLRPDMSLANSAQDKKFIAAGKTPLDKEFVTKSLSTREANSKSFAGLKGYFARLFETKIFTRAEAAADVKANADIAYASPEFTTKGSSLIRPSPDSTKRARAPEYADQRPFLAKGTRQEMLNQQQENKPLTIDEVRELLNKNK